MPSVTTARFRAWRFDFGQSPGLSVDTKGRIATTGELDSVQQSLLLLVATRPGERVMRPHYGCWLGRLVFAPNDDTTAGLAIHYIGQAIARWEPRVQVLKLDASRHPDEPGQLHIDLQYRVRGRSSTEALQLAFDLASGHIAA